MEVVKVKHLIESGGGGCQRNNVVRSSVYPIVLMPTIKIFSELKYDTIKPRFIEAYFFIERITELVS